jgi:hypothetical protein
MFLKDITSGLDDQRLETLIAKSQDDAYRWIAETTGPRPILATGSLPPNSSTADTALAVPPRAKALATRLATTRSDRPLTCP